jgi:hypothetical protein
MAVLRLQQQELLILRHAAAAKAISATASRLLQLLVE